MSMQTISRRVREREIERQVRYNHLRKAVLSRLPALLPEFLKMLLGAVIGFGIVAELLRRFAGVDPLYLLSAFGLLFSVQTAYYKIRLAANPDFRIPKCRCAGAANDKTELVLRSGRGSMFRIPTSVLGVGLYAALLTSVALQHPAAAQALAVAGVVTSTYLGYVMVARIAALCTTCVSIAALNLLILAQFVL